MGAEQELRGLMQRLMRNTIEVEDFAAQFEHVFNMELEKRLVRADVHESLSRVFEVAVWFSPFPDDRAKLAHYRSPEDVHRAVQHCLEELGLV